MEQTLLPNTLKNNLVVMSRKCYFLSSLLCCFCLNSALYATECTSYKIRPKIKIRVPEYNKQVVQSQKTMDFFHGDVIATMVNNYDIVADIKDVQDGYCVWLKSVEATIGYTDFLVQIDNIHFPQTCSYNAILSHENKHIDAYLSIIEEYKQDIYDSLYSTANTILPIFVKNKSELETVIDEMNIKLQNHPNIVLMIQKIRATEEIKNKTIDQQEDYSELKKCLK